MKSRRRSTKQVIRRLDEGDEQLNNEATVAEVPRSFQITDATWYRWNNTSSRVRGLEIKGLMKMEI
jgi:putative transposase